MKEQNSGKSKQREPLELEERLTAYYGPQLREQPLSQTSWQNLRLRLGSQEDPGRRQRMSWHLPRKRSQAFIPTFIQEAFTRIAYEARIPSRPSMLRFSLKQHLREPIVHSSWFGRSKIRLILPLNVVATLEQAELDVLLGTGLARSMGARKPGYTLGRLLLCIVMLLASLMLVLSWIHHILLVGIPLTIVVCVLVIWLMHLQARSIAFHADTLIVLWLGRSHVCSGLHALADRSRRPRRKRWGEPSLDERIERVCGARVETRDHQLTFVG